MVKLVKNPKLPMLMGKIGMPCNAATRAAASSVPSPPSTSNSFDPAAYSSRLSPCAGLGSAPAVSVS